ncbi:MAG: MFS transporter [Gammaproteobacteria bacterium]|nr:MFS transporter [Gammaproteobacteria bacterium]MCH9743532.1 MFS transporter [Gammaproteobacteria bacterium]
MTVSAEKKSLNVLYLIVFIDMLGFGVIIPLLPFLVSKMGASGLFAASLLSIFSLMQFIFSPILGRLSDKYGRKKILNLCLLGSVLSYGLYAIAFFVTKQSDITLLLIFVSRLIAGIMGANIPLAYSYIADTTKPEDRTGAMGKIGAAFGMGFIFGPAIAGLLAPLGLAAPGIAAMSICLVALFCAMLFLKESRDELVEKNPVEKLSLKQVAGILNHKVIGAIILVTLLYGFSFVQMESIYSLFIGHVYQLSQSQIAYLFVFVGVVIAVSQGALVGPLSKRIGNINLLFLGALLLAISFILLVYSGSIWLMLLSSAGISLSAGAINPTLSVIISCHVDRNKQGLTQGLNQSASSLSRIIGPIVAGFLYDHYHPTSPFVLGSLVMMLVAGIAYALKTEVLGGTLSFSYKNKLNKTRGEI